MDYYAIIIEGRTDCALIESILEKEFNMTLYNNLNNLPNIFKTMVGKFPLTSGELKYEGFSRFYYSDKDKSVIVKIANGNTKMAETIDGLLANLEIAYMDDENKHFKKFIIITDTDFKTVKEIEYELIKSCRDKEINMCTDDGTIYSRNLYKINYALYNIPKNSYGAVEKLLLECVKKVYPDLYNITKSFRKEIEENENFKDIRKQCWGNVKVQELYADKVQFGFVSAVLKPDKAAAMCVKDKLIRNKFLENLAMIPEYKLLCDFLAKELNL